ncbi:hypothetical protein GLOIN_2v1587390 [Rhizophagus clarus]|uniref:SAM domain-containing protein n=1 Tax=Rhizophagus clarus TaxID=94130 RepID=A0A8H3KW04_9GLOM|nr:hypothetical protein GLOIN_2v1587390 [Rhizophagus clarus]
MANIIDFRFKVHNKLDDDIFTIKIAWQTLVRNAIPTIREEMARRNIKVPNNIKLRVKDPRGPEKVLELDDRISKYFNINQIEEEQNLKLEEKHFNILRNEEITGLSFLNMTEEKLRSYGFKGGLATLLAKEVQALKEKPKRAFFSYKSLKEVLAKYGTSSDGMETIPLFSPEIHEVQDFNKHFEHCIENILFRMKNYRSLVLDSLESMRNEYVSTILHIALHIVGDIVSKEFSMRPEYEIIGDESCGRVNYAIKEAKNLICITEDKVQRSVLEGFTQNIKQLESSFVKR